MLKMKSLYLLLPLLMLITGEAVSAENGKMAGMTQSHNDIRAALNIKGLVWSDKIAATAQEWANYLAKNNQCKMEHRPKHGKYARQYGENIYWASALKWSDGRKEVQEISPAAVVKSWVDEAADYDYDRNHCRKGKVCGHYTQLIWRNSAKVGCGVAACADKGQIWVCNYDPAGNYIGIKPY